MSNGDGQALSARHLLAGRLHGVLSTHSLEHTGYPFGTLVPYVLGHDGWPVMLLSHLSQHTKNIDADPRCGLIVIADGNGDVQQLARLSAVGNLRGDPGNADAERYFRYFPAARDYFEQLGFRFYRFEPLRFHWNAGFATARWFGSDRIVAGNPLTDEAESRIIEHMNEDHGDALRTYCRDADIRTGDGPVMMVGIDAEGVDLRCGEQLVRIALPFPIETADDARQALIQMAR